MKTRKAFLVMLLCLLLGTVFVGCGESNAPEVNLNDYVMVTEIGYDGYGYIDVEVDFGRLVSEYSDRLAENVDTQYFGDQTAAMAAEFAFYTYQPYALTYEERQDLSNGDTIAFAWNSNDEAIEKLRSILDVKLTCENFTHTIQALESLTEVDPFANLQIDQRGVSCCICYGYEPSVSTGYIEAQIQLKGGSTQSIPITAQDYGEKIWKNGDTLHVSLENGYNTEQLAREHGIVLARTEADITLNDFAYFPSDKPTEIFELLSQESMNTAQKAMEDFYLDYAGDIKVTYVGALLYYADEHYDTEWEHNLNNQVVLIYHIDNGIYPGGWYNYLAPDCDAYVGYAENEEGKKTKMTIGKGAVPLFANAVYRHAIVQPFVLPGEVEVAQHFVHNDLYYAGFRTLEDCIKSMEYLVITHEEDIYGNVLEKNYNHLIATDDLKQYVTEH